MLFYEIAQGHPEDKTAFVFKGEKMDYGRFCGLVDAWAAFIQAKGIKKGDKVGLISKNSINFVLAYFSVIRAGGVVVPINFQLIAPEVAFIVKDTEMKLILCAKKLDLDAALKDEGCGFATEQVTFDEMPKEIGTVPDDVPMEENDNCTIIYTSGTTGKPKGAMLSHRNLIENTKGVINAFQNTKDDVDLCVLPMYHCFGWICSVCINVFVGATTVVQETYAFNETMSLIKEYGVTTFSGVPTMQQLFLKNASPEELKGIRYFIAGGAALPRILCESFEKKFGRKIQEGYGLSEASPVVSVNPGDQEHNKIGSIGLPLVDVTVEIQDKDGQKLPCGEVGELCVKGPNVMLGYWKRPEETRRTMRGGWLHTEDLAYMDGEGYIFLVDRLKDMIISSGENVYPREVEEVLMRHPIVAEAAVIGIPDKLRGQAICAYIVPKDGEDLTKKDLRKYLLSQMAPYKVPKEFIFADSLPRNSTGKILKTALRERSLVDLVNRRRPGM